ncbi:ArsR family transcriptional regulator [Knoellia sinensis KCTC 19936]|uniref:ArsR family transcriptional regulator n=1 Tax=Knoellia sinensis KCTC 19936 TaxID=1385520 RepID=A0A0A0J3Z6_9MICO|nr:helix-turn-helix transcriptional regulator [Knoellia sinensis]KGN32045.1 ArsR family transcriptional regulator [Knoellia sinensis KCTC 19936]
MVTYRIAERDLTMATFGISTLSETTLSLRAVWRPEIYPHMSPWRREIERRLAGVDLEMLLALVAPDYSTPEFLNPRPVAATTDFDAELLTVSRLPVRIVERDLDDLYPSGRPAALVGPTGRVLDRIVRALDEYWVQCVRPWWSPMHANLSGDITIRAVTSTRIGLRPMLSGLSPALTLEGKEIHAWNPSGPHFEADARGRGLVFVPTHFTPHASYPFNAEAPPYILYPALGRGRLALPDAAPERAARLLGDTRATLLVNLREPMSSTTVASRRGISVSAANQQLRWLRDVGLVASIRDGRSLLYFRTEAAEAFLGDLSPPT